MRGGKSFSFKGIRICISAVDFFVLFLLLNEYQVFLKNKVQKIVADDCRRLIFDASITGYNFVAAFRASFFLG